tara:strand:+ start:1009 stop:1131 length:123 start_codon:yes stop_codon:yes gene_type:complete
MELILLLILGGFYAFAESYEFTEEELLELEKLLEDIENEH